MQQAVSYVIYETLLDAEYGATTLRNLQVPELLAELRSDCIQWELSKRAENIVGDGDEDPGILLKELFKNMLLAIEFGPRQVTPIVYDVAPCLTHSLPGEIGNRKEFEHLFKLYNAVWNSQAASNPALKIRRPEATPIIVAKAYSNNNEDIDKLLGLSIIPTSQLLDHCNPFKSFWRTLHTPCVYKLKEQQIGLGTEGGLEMAEENVRVEKFATLWRVLQRMNSSSPLEIFAKLMESLKNRGDAEVLSNGWSVSIQHASKSPAFGEICFKTYFDMASEQRIFSPEPSLKSFSEWERYHSNYFRVPFDMFGGRLIPSIHNPAITTSTNSKKLQKRTEFEAADYEDIRSMESYTHLLEQHSINKWKMFLTRKVKDLPAINGGEDQWLSCEVALETSSEDPSMWSGNWMQSVDYNMGNNLPRYLIEVWVGDEFCGEHLLPNLAELAEVTGHQTLWPLVQDSSQSPELRGLARKDFRKQTAPLEVKGWIYLEARWALIHPRSGRLSLKVREARNISTKSVKPNEAIPGCPQIVVWEYNQLKKTWTKKIEFTPFHHALYFLSGANADVLMREHWTWDVPDVQEPTWFNYFSWDSPGSMCQETRTIPVQVKGEINLERQLKFHAIETRFDQIELSNLLWSLCKNGIPSKMRTYIWTELSGAAILKFRTDEYVRQASGIADDADAHFSAYDWIRSEATSMGSPAFDLIREDADLIGAAYGLDEGHREFLTRLVQTLIFFTSSPCANTSSSTSSSGQESDVSQQSLSFDKYGMKAGGPIMYTSALLSVAYYLSLDFGGSRFTEEEIFYIILSLFAVKKDSPYGLPQAPLFGYLTTKSHGNEEELVPSKTPLAFNDARMVATAIRLWHPHLSNILFSAGFNLETFLAPYFTTMFADLLPSQSLFRLWDMIFNLIWSAREILDSDFSFEQIDKAISRRRGEGTQRDSASGILALTCVMPTGLDGELEAGHGTGCRAHKVLFNNSMGRRILFCFAYSFVVLAFHSLPDNPTSTEIRDSLHITGARLRDPSEIVRLVERADFLVFTSRSRINALYKVFILENEEREKQLDKYRLQSSVISRVLHPPIILKEKLPSGFVLTYNQDPQVSRSDKINALCCTDTRLSTKDLKTVLYPTIKYHTLYANPEIRKLLKGTHTRVIVDVRRLRHLKSTGFNTTKGEKLEICTSVDHQWKSVYFATTETNQTEINLKEDGIFVFHCSDSFPYSIKFVIKNEAGEIIYRLLKSLPIRKQVTQSSGCKLVSSSNFSPSDIEAFISWMMFSPSGGVFLTDELQQKVQRQFLSGSSESLKLGTGNWGDLVPFDPMFVEVAGKSPNEIDDIGEDVGSITNDEPDNHSLRLQDFKPLERPRSFVGADRAATEELLHFVLPHTLNNLDAIINTFAGVGEDVNFQQLFQAKIPLRELVTSLIFAATGSILDKTLLLFDLFGHHEPEKAAIQNQNGEANTIGSNALYYHPVFSPIANSVVAYKQLARLRKLETAACKVDAFLPKDSGVEIIRDPRIKNNSISLAECAAVISQILPRGSFHLNAYDQLGLACRIFEPMGRFPRVLSATLVSGAPQASQYGK